MLKHLKHHWKRAVSGLMAAVLAAGMLPVSGLAASETVHAPTGDFELNIAGTTAWSGGEEPLTVYSTQTGTTQAAEIPAGEPFALLENSGGDRLKVGSEGGWTGSTLEDTGWADKETILVNLPDLIPSIAYVSESSEPQFSSRLTRFEYVIPAPYSIAEELAQLQQQAMEDGETLIVRMDGQTVTLSRTKGDLDSLEEYSLDGAVYQKYGEWTEYTMEGRLRLCPALRGDQGIQRRPQYHLQQLLSPARGEQRFGSHECYPHRRCWGLQPRQSRRAEARHLQCGLGHRPGSHLPALHPHRVSPRSGH